MDYDVVKTSVQNAYNNFGRSDVKFYSAMSTFYKEGKKNPSVAKIIMQDNIRKNQEVASQMLKDAAAFPLLDVTVLAYPEMLRHSHQLYDLSLNAAMKSINAEQIYKNTEYVSEEVGLKEASDFQKTWNELYPKTGKKRERIIKANRISMDKVSEKADWSEKVNYAKTVEEYKKDYPKTFNARLRLLFDGQIEDENVTSRVSGWFKRFSYKRLIKKGFSFKK